MTFKLGDVVSLLRAQSTLVTVASTPAAPGETYALTLPINGAPRTFAVEADPGETLDAIAERLRVELVNAQTVYVVGLDELVPSRLLVVGGLGDSYVFSTTPNLTAAVFLAAVDRVGDDGQRIGPLRVIVPESIVGRPPRKYTTILWPTREVRNVERAFVRELGTGNQLDIDTAEVLTVLET